VLSTKGKEKPRTARSLLSEERLLPPPPGEKRRRLSMVSGVLTYGGSKRGDSTNGGCLVVDDHGKPNFGGDGCRPIPLPGEDVHHRGEGGKDELRYDGVEIGNVAERTPALTRTALEGGEREEKPFTTGGYKKKRKTQGHGRHGRKGGGKKLVQVFPAFFFRPSRKSCPGSAKEGKRVCLKRTPNRGTLPAREGHRSSPPMSEKKRRPRC